MGTWSANIFDNDGAEEIKEEYETLLSDGMSVAEAYKRIEEYFYPDYKDQDDEDVYWLSIALFQWENGILQDEVKQHALECIANDEYLEIWKEDAELYAERKHVLEDLKYKLTNEKKKKRKRFSKRPLDEPYDKLIPMEKSRKKIHEGDVFCIQPLRGVFYFGKVIMVNIEHPSLLLNGEMLIYIYDVCSDDQYSIPELNENHILCAPMIISDVPWRTGYFKNVGNMEVLDSEKQLDYGFAHMGSVNKKYFDINDNVMDHVPHYCGVYGLASYRAVGGEIHKVIDNG